jgi:dihydroxyacetone kinase-like protein
MILDALAAVHRSILANESAIESLDRAIGDGDHFINVRRGCEVLAVLSPDLKGMLPGLALHRIGVKLLGTIGGASGPLISSFFMAMGKALEGADEPDRRQFAAAFASGVEAIKLRGKADVGEKTMLDVLIPVSRLLLKLADEDATLPASCEQLKEEASRNKLATTDMIASKGRASFLGERALGHIDPGC